MANKFLDISNDTMFSDIGVNNGGTVTNIVRVGYKDTATVSQIVQALQRAMEFIAAKGVTGLQ